MDSDLLETVDDTPLDRDDAFFIMKALGTVIAQWQSIGMCFGLDAKLDTIQADNSDVHQRMKAVVEGWLKRNYNTKKFGEPTWRKLVEVVGDPIGGNDANHARKLAKEHPLKRKEPTAQAKDDLTDSGVAAQAPAEKPPAEKPPQANITLAQKDGPDSSKVKKSIKLRWQRKGQAKVDDEVITMQRGTVAVKGSTAFFGRSENVYAFDYDKNRWFDLPEVQKGSFRLVIVNELLTAVGGFVGSVATGTLLSLDESSGKQEWTEVFPPMPTARGRPAVVCTGHSLVAAGGSIKTPTRTFLPLDTVEVMDTDYLLWLTASSLPQPVTDMMITLCDEKLFLLGGRVGDGTESSTDGDVTQVVYSCSLLPFLQSCHCQSESQTSKRFKLTVWKELKNIPSYYSSCASICGNLLSVGGCDQTRSIPSDAVYQYDPIADAWNVVGRMPTARHLCIVAVLPNDKLLAVGGSIERHNWIAMVEIASVSFK